MRDVYAGGIVFDDPPTAAELRAEREFDHFDKPRPSGANAADPGVVVKNAIPSWRSDLGSVAFSLFWERVDIRGPEDCWEWTRASSTSGYGHTGADLAYGERQAHRAALAIKLGRPLAEGMFACHTCDNRRCCNPAHLWEGTAADNNRDCREKGRHSNGRPWTGDEIALIVRQLENGHSLDEVAADRDRDKSSIGQALARRGISPRAIRAERNRAIDTQVLYLRNTGLTARQIADELGLTRKAVLRRLDRLRASTSSRSRGGVAAVDAGSAARACAPDPSPGVDAECRSIASGATTRPNESDPEALHAPGSDHDA